MADSHTRKYYFFALGIHLEMSEEWSFLFKTTKERLVWGVFDME